MCVTIWLLFTSSTVAATWLVGKTVTWLAVAVVSEMIYNMSSATLNPTLSICLSLLDMTIVQMIAVFCLEGCYPLAPCGLQGNKYRPLTCSISWHRYSKRQLNHNYVVLCLTYAVVTYEIKLFQHSLTSVWNIIARNYFRGLKQIVNIFQHVQCRWNYFEIISAAEIILI